MKALTPFVAALGLIALPAFAGDHESATGAAHEALEAQANPPKAPPTLPDEASARAKYVQQHIAHHKNGAEEKAEHAKSDSDSDAAHHADGDSDDSSSKSAQGAAASAAKSANSDSHAAAGQARATEARGGNPPGSGNPHGKGHGPH